MATAIISPQLVILTSQGLTENYEGSGFKTMPRKKPMCYREVC